MLRRTSIVVAYLFVGSLLLLTGLPGCGDGPAKPPGADSPKGQPTEPFPGDGPRGVSGAGPDAAAGGLDPAWWKRTPAVRLVLTGGQRGQRTPCGCSAPRKGGYERTASVLYRLREAGRARGTVVGALSLGWSLRGRLEPQEEAQADYLRGVRASLGYSAALLGAPELLVPAMCQPRGPGAGSPTPPLNVMLPPTNPASGATRFYADFSVGPVAVRALSIIDPSAAQALADAGFVQAVSSASQNMGGLRPSSDVLWIAATRVHGEGTLSEIRSGLKRLGAGIVVDVAASGHGKSLVEGFALAPGGEPLVIELQDFGTAVGVLDLDPAKDGKGWIVSYRQIDLVPQWEKYGGPAIKAVRQLTGLYRAMVKRRGYLLESPRVQETGATYMGSSACAACHQAIYKDWKRTPHALALQTLQRSGDQWDPACIRCHAVGWERTDAEDWTVFQSGFRDPERTPYLGGVGCESCHGPGSAHGAAPRKFPLEARPAKATCLRCHDAENSHGFAEGFASEALPGVDHHGVPDDLKTVVPKGG